MAQKFELDHFTPSFMRDIDISISLGVTPDTYFIQHAKVPWMREEKVRIGLEAVRDDIRYILHSPWVIIPPDFDKGLLDYLAMYLKDRLDEEVMLNAK